ncbi:MAG: hypothetical protein OER88_13675 [Planctomycetota bacterium]|nr:hypothetical protein [Planctomycetota bacterium]
MSSRTSFLVLASLVLGASLASGRPGPHTAMHIGVLPAPFKVGLTARGSCVPRFFVTLARDLPNPAWSMAVDKIDFDRKAQTVRIDVTAKRKPGVIAPQVIVPTQVEAELGFMRRGRYLVSVRYRKNDAEYALVQALVLVAR